MSDSAIVPKIKICEPSWKMMKGVATSGKRISATASAALAGVNSAETISPAADGFAGSAKPRPRVAHDPLRAQRERDHHDDEGQHDTVGREIDEPKLLGESDEERANRCADDGAHASDDDDDERRHEVAHVLARRDGTRRAADDPGEAGKRPADGEDANEQKPHVACRGRRRQRESFGRTSCG